MFLVPLTAGERCYQNWLCADGSRFFNVTDHVADECWHVSRATWLAGLVVVTKLNQIIITLQRERIRPAAFAPETFGAPSALRRVDAFGTFCEKLLEAETPT